MTLLWLVDGKYDQPSGPLLDVAHGAGVQTGCWVLASTVAGFGCYLLSSGIILIQYLIGLLVFSSEALCQRESECRVSLELLD